MTAVSDAGSTPLSNPERAPLTRLLRSELRWVLRRPRTQIALGLLALVPVLIGIGIVATDSPGGSGLLTQITGNGLVLPVVALSISLTLLLPLAVTMAAADALAGESAHGTLRGLLLAPVSRTRLVLVKAIGVLAVAVAAVAAVAVLGMVTGLVLIGPSGSTNGMLTLSGTEVGGIGAAAGFAGRRLDRGAACRCRRRGAGGVLGHRPPAGGARGGVGRLDRVRGALRDPRSGLAAAGTDHHRLVRDRRCAA